MAAKKGMHQEELLTAAAELAGVIESGRADLGKCTELLDRWADVVQPTGLSVAEVLRVELREMLDSPGLREQEPYAGRLLAARWLLNLGSYTLSDARQDMGRMGDIRALTDKQLGDKGVRSQIAFVCLQWEAYWRADRQPGAQMPEGARTAFNRNGSRPSPRTRDVAAELARAIDERRAQFDDRAFLEERRVAWRDTLRPVTTTQSNRHDGKIGQAFRRLADVWNEPARHYPQHLTPLVLAQQLTVSPLPERHNDHAADSRHGLYNDERTYNGRPVVKVMSEERRLVVLGNPGGGKSTALVSAVVDRVEHGAPAILVRLSSIAQPSRKRRRWTLERVVELLVKVAASDTVTPEVSSKTLAQELLSADDALIALDGLDEVQAECNEYVRAIVRALADFSGTVVVSSRWTGYTALPGSWEERCIDNLDINRAGAFFDSWFDGTNRSGLERARSALDRRVSTRSELTEIPVLLGIVAVVAAEREVPATEPLLYEKYVSMFLEGHWRPYSARVDLEERLRRLTAARNLAWAMATGMKGQVAGREWSDVVTPHALHRHDPALLPALEGARVIGLLTPQGKSPTELHQEHRWIHRTVHEHLVGAYFAPRFVATSEHFGLPPEILMSAPQWQQPLRHLVGLLSEADQEALISGMESIADAGDPGGRISDLSRDLALVLPHGARVRQRLAQKRAGERHTYDVYLLDIACYKALILDMIREGDESEMYTTMIFDDDAVRLEEAWVRELVECQRAVPHVNSDWVVVSSNWLSRFDPDAALRFVVETKIQLGYDSFYPRWVAVPSPSAVEAAIEVIAEHEPIERLNFLRFLVLIGVDLTLFASTVGRLDALEVQIATTLADSFQKEGAERADQWPDGVAESIFSGKCGADRAFASTVEQREYLPHGIQFGAVAQLALDTWALAKRSLTPISAVEPNAAVELIASVTPERILDDVVALQMVTAASALLDNAEHVSVKLCFKAHWALGKCGFPPYRDPRFGTFRYRYTMEAIARSVIEVLLARGNDLVDEILDTDPNAWAASTHKYSDFEIVKALYDRGSLSVPDLVKLIVWAGREDVQMLHYLRLGDLAPTIAQLVWDEDPRAFVSNSHEWGVQLADSGVLWQWRDRLIDASAYRKALLDQWESAGSN